MAGPDTCNIFGCPNLLANRHHSLRFLPTEEMRIFYDYCCKVNFLRSQLEKDFDCLYKDKIYDINEIFPHLKQKIFDFATKRSSAGRDKYLQQVIALQNGK